MRFRAALALVVSIAVGLAVWQRDARAPEPVPVARAATSVRAEASRGCASRVESGGRRASRVRPDPSDVATRSVILHGVRAAERFDPDDAYRPGGGDAMFKTAVSLRAGARVVLELVPRGGARLALDYDRTAWSTEGRTLAAGHGQRAVAFSPCAPDEPRFSGPGEVGPWTQWNGGLLIATPGCATLHVWRDGRRVERADIAVGIPARRCA